MKLIPVEITCVSGLQMPRNHQLTQVLLMFVLISITGLITTSGQSHLTGQPIRKASICGNPKLACKTTATFQPNDLPFRVPARSVIYDTELFYAVILKSIPAAEDNCQVFVAEAERLEAQSLFPERKVFTSRCVDIENLFYTNVDPKFRIMAVYGGTTLAEAQQVLSGVKKTGKFPEAYTRRMRTGFNGT